MSKNLHLTHIDEYLYETGVNGAYEALSTFHSILEGRTNATVKIDGAPAIFCGHDPKDRKFFVGTKSVFNANPKIYKTPADIDANEKGEKAHKLKECLKYLPDIGIPEGTVLQGDLLWTEGDQTMKTIKNKRYVTVHPNTLVYAWEANTPMANKVRSAKLGIAFHTTYKGLGDLQSYTAQFGANTGNLHSNSVMFTDTKIRTNPQFSAEDVSSITEKLSDAQQNISNFDKIVEVMNMLPKSYIGAGIKSFVNQCVRENRYPTQWSGYREYVSFVTEYWNEKVIPSVKTEKGVASKKAALKQFKLELGQIQNEIEESFAFINQVKAIKEQVLEKFNATTMQESFVKMENGYFDVPPEGYVVVGETAALKLVDRLSFSRFNFNEEYIKGWA